MKSSLSKSSWSSVLEVKVRIKVLNEKFWIKDKIIQINLYS
jgi:hypothetical protein